MTNDKNASKQIPTFTYDDSKLPKVTLFKLIFSYISLWEGIILLLGTIGAIGDGITSRLLDYFVGDLIDAFTELEDKNNGLHEVTKISLIYVLVGVLSFISSYLMMGMFTLLSKRLGCKYKIAYFSNLMQMKQEWFDQTKKTPQEFSNQVMLELDMIQSTLGPILGYLISEIASFIAGISFGLTSFWKLSLIILSLLPIWVVFEIYILFSVAKNFDKRKVMLQRISGYLEEILYKIKTVFSFGNYEYEREKFSIELRDVLKNGKTLIVKTSLNFGIFHFLLYLMYLFGLVFGSIMLSKDMKNNKKISVGKLYTSITMVTESIHCIYKMIPNLRRLSECYSSSKFFFELDRYSKEMDKYEKSKKFNDIDIEGTISLDNVTFSYPMKKDINIISDLTLEIKKGKMTAIVGQSGSGKSTVIKLIERMYSPSKGKIVIDGQYDSEEINIRYYRAQFGYVSQEPILFNESIRNNITLGRECSESEIERAVKLSRLSQLVKGFSDGIDHVIGVKGCTLSGGQKQKISIARALLKNPKIIVLDEATSSLDKKNEEEIQLIIESLKGQCTIISVSQKLSFIKNADNIIVFGAHGKILEQGTHDELMVNKGEYYNLYTLDDCSNDEKEDNKKTTLEKTFSSTLTNNSILTSDFTIPIDDKKVNTQRKNESAMLKFFKVLSSYKLLFALGATCSLIDGLIHSFIDVLFGKGTDKFYLDNPDDVKREGIKYGLYYLILCFGSFTIVFFRHFSFDYLSEKLSSFFKQKTFEFFLAIDIAFFDDPMHAPGKLVSQIEAKTASINGVVLAWFTMLIESVGTIITSNCIGFYYDYRMTLINIAFIPFVLIVNYFLIVFTSQDEKNSNNPQYGGILSESVKNISTIKSFNAEGFAQVKFNECVYKATKRDVLYSNLIGIFYGLTLCVIFFDYSATFYGAGHFILKDTLTIDAFLASFGTILHSTLSIGTVLKYLKEINKTKEAVACLFDNISNDNTNNSIIKCSNNSNSSNANASPSHFQSSNLISDSLKRGKIEFINVSFAYPSNPKHLILKSVSFTINPGEKVAFIGESGAGKSTIVQLIQRFYDPQEGQILIDDVDIKNYHPQCIKKSISYVQQEPMLFSRSIDDNIKYGKLNADREEVEKIASECKIEYKLTTNLERKEEPQKEREGKGESKELSGGEKQKVSLARALIRKPRIIILDEATNALDNIGERKLQEVIEEKIEKEKMTAVFIAHRLRPILKCDKVFLMKKGKIVKEGNIGSVMANIKIL